MSSPFIGLSCIFWLIGFTNYPGGSHYPLSYRSIKKAKIVLNFAYLDPFQYGFALLKKSDDVPINRRDHFLDESINFMLKSTVHNDPTLEIYGRLFICQPQKTFIYWMTPHVERLSYCSMIKKPQILSLAKVIPVDQFQYRTVTMTGLISCSVRSAVLP